MSGHWTRTCAVLLPLETRGHIAAPTPTVADGVSVGECSRIMSISCVDRRDICATWNMHLKYVNYLMCRQLNDAGPFTIRTIDIRRSYWPQSWTACVFGR